MNKGKAKKITRKKVSIRNSEVLKKRVLKSSYSKLQVWVSNIFKLDLVEKHQYVFRIEYYGSARLSINDVVVNSQGVIFVVVRELNRMAVIVSKDDLVEKPKVYGSLILLET